MSDRFACRSGSLLLQFFGLLAGDVPLVGKLQQDGFLFGRWCQISHSTTFRCVGPTLLGRNHRTRSFRQTRRTSAKLAACLPLPSKKEICGNGRTRKRRPSDNERPITDGTAPPNCTRCNGHVVDLWTSFDLPRRGKATAKAFSIM